VIFCMSVCERVGAYMGWFVDMLRMLVLNAIVGFKDFLRLLKLAVQDKQVPCGLLFPHAHTPSVWFVCVCVLCVYPNPSPQFHAQAPPGMLVRSQCIAITKKQGEAIWSA